MFEFIKGNPFYYWLFFIYYLEITHRIIIYAGTLENFRPWRVVI